MSHNFLALVPVWCRLFGAKGDILLDPPPQMVCLFPGEYGNLEFVFVSEKPFTCSGAQLVSLKTVMHVVAHGTQNIEPCSCLTIAFSAVIGDEGLSGELD